MKDEKKPYGVNGVYKSITGAVSGVLAKFGGKRAFSACAYCICAYLFAGAQTVLQTYPMGIAFMCAVNDHIPLAFLGVCVSALVSEDPVSALFGCLISISFRYGLHCLTVDRTRLFLYTARDGVLSKVCSACAGLLCTSLVRIVAGGFTYYDLLACIFSVSAGGGMVYVFTLVTDKKNRYTQHYEAGVSAVMFTACLSLKYAQVLGMSCGGICAFLFPVYIAKRGGCVRGALTGFLCGAALDVSLCPIFAAVGFVCGILPQRNTSFAVISSIACGAVLGMYTVGFDTVLLYMPEAVCAAALYIPLEKLSLLPRLRIFRQSAMYENALSVNEISEKLKCDGYYGKARSLSETLSEISEVICALSDRERRPAVHEICELCENEFSSFCKKCSMKKLCFPKGIRSDPGIRRTAAAIYDKGALSSEDLPEKIKTGCYFADKLTVSINVKLSSYISEKLRHNKTEVMAEDYQRISELISCAVNKTHSENELNKELTEKLMRYNIYRDLFGANVGVYGNDNVTVIACGEDVRKINAQKGELQRTFGKILKVRLDTPTISASDACAYLIMKQAKLFCCEYSTLQYAKDGQIINGDTVFATENDTDFYSCICDGMGSGEKASLTSKLAGVFLQRLLCAKCEISPVMKMLNHFVRCKTDECFTTVDLACVDLKTGKASFIKSGASVSFVVRSGRIFRLASHTPPIGIMKELCSEKIEFSFKNGDVAVMVSDGVSDCEDELLWLYDLLSEEYTAPCEELCRKIADTAKERSGGADDITVCAFRLSLT